MSVDVSFVGRTRFSHVYSLFGNKQYASLPGNVLELLPECVVEPAVEDRVGEGGGHADQVAGAEHHAVKLVHLKKGQETV